MLDTLNEEQKGFLNEIAYINLPSDWAEGGKGYTLGDLLEQYDDAEFNEFINDDKNQHLKNLVITDYVNNNDNNSKSGFAAIAFKDPVTGQVGMSFRGSENKAHVNDEGKGQNWIKDMWDNVLTSTIGTSPQSIEAIAFYERNKDKDGNNYLYGHSKGGEIATSIYVLDYINISGVHVINAQPINSMKLLPDQIAALQSSKFNALVVNGDIVAWLGARVYPVKFVVNNGEAGGPFGPHSIGNIEYKNNGNALIEPIPFSGHFWKGVASIVSTVAVSAVQIATRIPALVTNIVVRVGSFLVYDLPNMVLQFVEFSKNAIDTIQKFNREIKDALKNLVGEIANNISNWYNKNFNKSYNEAKATSEIKVDIYKLRDYAVRLQTVNNKLASVDNRLNSLYKSVSFFDWGKVLGADLKTSESSKVKGCMKYLNNTASAFEKAEQNIMNSLC